MCELEILFGIVSLAWYFALMNNNLSCIGMAKIFALAGHRGSG